MCGIIGIVQFGTEPMFIAEYLACLEKLTPRGPDAKKYMIIEVNGNCKIFLGFTRLAIMDMSDSGLQPFVDKFGNAIVCNGEIYNYKKIAHNYNITLSTSCDCEILLPLINSCGFINAVANVLDAEFATIFYNKNDARIYAARDKYGVRPLYYGKNASRNIMGFSSELKAIHSIMEHVQQLKPNFIAEIDLNQNQNLGASMIEYFSFASFTSAEVELESKVGSNSAAKIEILKTKINALLTEAVKKRLISDRKIGFLLSGGLDSSLIVSIASRILNPDDMICFSIGLENSPDVVAAKKVVEYLKIKHHHIIPFSVQAGISELPNVIECIETYDITTIRASTPQYIMAKYINENTDIKVLLSGEGSDEIHGSYRYFRDAPNSNLFHIETIRLLSNLFYFDNKRTDRTMADNGLEVRVPFLDYDYVNFITRIDPNLLMSSRNVIEKKLIRDSFCEYLPTEILYRSKEAFSDAVSNEETNWAQSVCVLASSLISDDELALAHVPFPINTPKTKDALYFRKIFTDIYPGRDSIIPYYWLPRFQTKEINDPSACVLDCY